MGVNGKSEQLKDVIDLSPHAKTKVASTGIDSLFFLFKYNKETELAVGIVKRVL